jgi:hypothetical protein
MFAPIPKSANAYIEAEVVYRDGSRKTWAFPRMEQLGLAEKYFRERYRKFIENLPRDENDPLRCSTLPAMLLACSPEQHSEQPCEDSHSHSQMVIHCSPS